MHDNRNYSKAIYKCPETNFFIIKTTIQWKYFIERKKNAEGRPLTS